MDRVLKILPKAAAESDACLVVDLDHTLVRTDLLIESLLAMVRTRPAAILRLPFWALRGRAFLKQELAQRIHLDVGVLPYREAVLDLIVEARSVGRRVMLVTATHRRLAEEVAAHLGLFDDVLASDGQCNLKGMEKAKAIVQQLHGEPFDYAGDSAADLVIWRLCRKPILVAARRHTVAVTADLAKSRLVISERRNWLLDWLRLVRVHQWLKNLLILVPLMAAQQATDFGKLRAVVIAFFAFSLCASSVYILNDLLDLEADRHHGRKRHRPLAAGRVRVLHGIIAFPLLLGVSLALSLAEPLRFVGVLSFYYLSTVLYSFWAKRRIVVDVIILAGLYTLRLLAGSAATDIAPSFWLLALSDFIFLSLALSKRYCELIRLRETGSERAPGRAYVPLDAPVLLALGAGSGCCAVLVMALYVNNPDVLPRYSHPHSLWLICPLLLFWLTHLWMKANRAEVNDDPVVWAVTDPTSLVVGALCAATVVFGIW